MSNQIPTLTPDADWAELTDAANELDDALLAITGISRGSIPFEVQVFTGIQFYTNLAHSFADSPDDARKLIELGVEWGIESADKFKLSQEQE
tara:strand:- start:48 stop:323 length:276 start_codon:yes stop_codon:yes gene_type:complete